jgi:hypothetical protein
MSPVAQDDAYEDRLVILEELGIEENALEHDEFTDEVSASSDEAAVKRFFARAFQEWAEGNVQGSAQEIFEGVITLLDTDWPKNAKIPVAGNVHLFPHWGCFFLRGFAKNPLPVEGQRVDRISLSEAIS